MKQVSKALLLVFLAGVLTTAPFTAHAGPIQVFNTGVDDFGNLLGDGAVDSHYQLIVSADPLFPGPDALTIDNANYPLGDSPDWLPNGTNSRWIGPRADTSRSEGNAAGEYIYRTTFLVEDIDPALVRLSGQWLVDDYGVILLNGQSTGITRMGELLTFKPFSITTGFISGINTLDFVVTNGDGPTGLRVELTASVVPEPGSLISTALGLGAFGGLAGVLRTRTTRRTRSH